VSAINPDGFVAGCVLVVNVQGGAGKLALAVSRPKIAALASPPRHAELTGNASAATTATNATHLPARPA
jgi:hypothetical protein